LVQVIDHAATIKQLQAADSVNSRLEASIQENIQGKAIAEAKQVGRSTLFDRMCLEITFAPHFPRHSFQFWA
jgi:hypothetical protein